MSVVCWQRSAELGDQLNHNRHWNWSCFNEPNQTLKEVNFLIEGDNQWLLTFNCSFQENPAGVFWTFLGIMIHRKAPTALGLPHCYRSLALHVDNPVHVPNHQLMFETPALVTWKSIVLIRVIIWTLLSYPIRHDCVMIQRSAPTRAVHCCTSSLCYLSSETRHRVGRPPRGVCKICSSILTFAPQFWHWIQIQIQRSSCGRLTNTWEGSQSPLLSTVATLISYTTCWYPGSQHQASLDAFYTLLLWWFITNCFGGKVRK